MASGIIEKLSNDSANGYCKFPDGTLICWGSVTISSSYQSWGAMYVSDANPDVTFPAPFLSAPALSVTCKEQVSGVIVNAVCTATKWNQVAIMRQSSGTFPVPLSYIAIGRWK